MSKRTVRAQRIAGFTLIELLVVIAVVGVLLTIAAPSFTDFIRMQRLKGVHAELMSDLQFARSEAIARNTFMRIRFQTNASRSCYVIYTSRLNSTRCDCLLGAGAACTGTMVEVRTVSLPAGDYVRVGLPAGQVTAFAFDHVTGGIMRLPNDDEPTPLNQFIVNTYIDGPRTLRTTIGTSGRPTVCAPGSVSVGAPAC